MLYIYIYTRAERASNNELDFLHTRRDYLSYLSILACSMTDGQWHPFFFAVPTQNSYITLTPCISSKCGHNSKCYGWYILFSELFMIIYDYGRKADVMHKKCFIYLFDYMLYACLLISICIVPIYIHYLTLLITAGSNILS